MMLGNTSPRDDPELRFAKGLGGSDEVTLDNRHRCPTSDASDTRDGGEADDCDDQPRLGPDRGDGDQNEEELWNASMMSIARMSVSSRRPRL